MENKKLKVTLVDCTGKTHHWPAHYAAALLVFAKETRLEMNPEGFSSFIATPYDELVEKLDYISKTIPASWEFVDLTFAVENVTRACIQQMTRTRYTPAETDIFGSYAAQSQRVTDMSDAGFRVPPNARHAGTIKGIVGEIMEAYELMLQAGELPEDARAILPMNLQGNILVKYTLRGFVDVVRARQSLRAQDEYRELCELMVEQVRAVYPWIDLFLRSRFDTAIEIIEAEARKLPTEAKRALAKAADLLRKEG